MQHAVVVYSAATVSSNTTKRSESITGNGELDSIFFISNRATATVHTTYSTLELVSLTYRGAVRLKFTLLSWRSCRSSLRRALSGSALASIIQTLPHSKLVNATPNIRPAKPLTGTSASAGAATSSMNSVSRAAKAALIRVCAPHRKFNLLQLWHCIKSRVSLRSAH
eukprot:19462-Heterococcus_DN1.PRE.3